MQKKKKFCDVKNTQILNKALCWALLELEAKGKMCFIYIFSVHFKGYFFPQSIKIVEKLLKTLKKQNKTKRCIKTHSI